MQTGVLGFQRAASGLLVPAPRGLLGFQRQTMAQTKKSSGLAFVGLGIAMASVVTPIPLPAGTQPGDVLILIGNRNSNPVTLSNSATWSGLSAALVTDVGGSAVTKICDGGDFSATFDGAGFQTGVTIWAFRSFASAVYATSLSDGTGSGAFGTTFSVPGFVKHPKTRALLMYTSSNEILLARTITTPALMLASPSFAYTPADQIPVGGPNASTYPRTGAVLMNASAYVDNAVITMNIPAVWNQAVAGVIELRVA